MSTVTIFGDNDLPTAQGATGAVDEDGLAAGIGDSTQTFDAPETSASTSGSLNVAIGPDNNVDGTAMGSVAFDLSGLVQTNFGTLTSGGQEVSYRWAEGDGAHGTLYGETGGGFEQEIEPTLVFTVVLTYNSETGWGYEFTLNAQVDHPDSRFHMPKV